MDQPVESPFSTPTPQDSPNHPPQSATGDSVGQKHAPEPQSHASAPPIGVSRPTKPSSCYACRQRKGRCDRQNPCSYCKRVNISCVYPTRRAPRGSLLPQNHPGKKQVDLIDRLRKLEGVVQSLKGAVDVNAPGTIDPSTTPQDESSMSAAQSFQPRSGSGDFTQDTGSYEEPKPSETTGPLESEHVSRGFGRMVVNDRKGTTRYVSSVFWTKLNDELDSIRNRTQELVDEYDEESDFETSPDSPDKRSDYGNQGGFIFGFSSTNVDLLKLHPLPSHVQLLWSIYQENVEPMVKMLHIPTAHDVLRTARDRPADLTPGQQALVFSIYHAAMTSLEPDEVQSYFNVDKDNLLPQYRFAIEQALAKANFLNTSDITVVQAFAIFLTVVRRHDPSRFCWSLSALLIHIARGMGLHRDGSHFNLSPFETEIRRRVWWSLIILDVRHSEEYGTALVIADGSYDTKMPSNIDDADINPSTPMLPEPKEGGSDCTIAYFRYELSSFARHLVNVLSAPNPQTTDLDDKSLSDREASLVSAYHHLKLKVSKPFLKETDSLYWAAVMLSRASIARLAIILHQPTLFPRTSRSLPRDIHQQVYISATEIMEYSQSVNKIPELGSFRWNFITWTNWHSVIYVLIQSCRRAWTPLVQRAWDALNSQERNPIEVTRATDHNAVFFPMRRLYIMAQKHRMAEMARLRSNLGEAFRLEAEERIAYAEAKLSTRLSEHKMKQATEKWHMMLRGNDPALTRVASDKGFDQNIASTLEQATFSMLQPQVISGNKSPTHFQTSMDIDINTIPFQPINDSVAQSSGLFDSDGFLPLIDDPLSNPATDIDMGTVPMPTTGANSLTGSTDFPPQMPPDKTRGQRSLLQLSQLTVDNMPQWLQFDSSLPANNNSIEDIDKVDMELLCDGFDWQNWSQNLNGMGNEGPIPPPWR